MTVELAVQYIPNRMNELGFGDKYHIRFRHFVLAPGEQREIDADDHIYILLEGDDSFTVESDFGIFDMISENTNELQYEHQGLITITNNTAIQQHIRFIQIIPKKENDAR